MLPSCLNWSLIRAATDTKLCSIPRRPTEIRTPWFAGTAMSGVLVNVQVCGNAGSGGNSAGLGWQPTVSNGAAVIATPTKRLRRFTDIENRRIRSSIRSFNPHHASVNRIDHSGPAVARDRPTGRNSGRRGRGPCAADLMVQELQSSSRARTLPRWSRSTAQERRLSIGRGCCDVPNAVLYADFVVTGERR